MKLALAKQFKWSLIKKHKTILLAEQQTVIDRNNRANKFIRMMQYWLVVSQIKKNFKTFL